MACCVLMALVLGGVASLKAWLFSSSRPTQQAQEWRLSESKENNEAT